MHTSGNARIMQQNGNKTYIEVTARFTLLGEVFPSAVRWHDGRCFCVSKTLSLRFMPITGSSLCPVRYECVIEGERRYLYFERDTLRWFVLTRNA